MACTTGLKFCVCDACVIETAKQHADGDIEAGRDWACNCAACRRARAIKPTLEIDVRFARLARLQERLDAVRAVARMGDEAAECGRPMHDHDGYPGDNRETYVCNADPAAAQGKEQRP
jgi:hypothetical protein